MLEQNSGRIYWVIGAVVILSIIMTMGSDGLPDVFKSIIKSFEMKIPKF